MTNINNKNPFELLKLEDGSIKLAKADNSIEEAIIPSGVTVIGERAFAMCSNLKHVVVPATVSIVEKEAFRMCCCLRSVIFEQGASVKITDFAFADCSRLEEINLFGVSEIGQNVFQDCSSLKMLDNMDDVVSFNFSSVAYCALLKTLSFSGNITKIDDNGLPACAIEHIHYSGTKKAWSKLRQAECNYYDVENETIFIFLNKPHSTITVSCCDGELTEKYYSYENVEDENEGDWSNWVAPWLPEPLKKLWRDR